MPGSGRSECLLSGPELAAGLGAHRTPIARLASGEPTARVPVAWVWFVGRRELRALCSVRPGLLYFDRSKSEARLSLLWHNLARDFYDRDALWVLRLPGEPKDINKSAA